MKFKNILPFIGILIFIYIIFRIGLDKILESVFSINVYLIIIAFTVSFFALIPPIVKWMIILKNQGIILDFWTLFKIDLIGMFYGGITPGRLGTFIRVFYLKDKIKKHFGACSSSIVIDKVLDFMSICLFAVIGSFLLLNEISGLFTLAFTFFVLLVGLFIFFLNKKRSRFILRLVWKFFIQKRFKRVAIVTFDSFYGNMPKIKTIFIPFLIAIISLALAFTTTYIVGRALNITMPYILFITILSLATLVSLVPITIGGLGTREAALITLFSIFNIPAADVVTMSIVASIISTIVPGILGWYFAMGWKYED